MRFPGACLLLILACVACAPGARAADPSPVTQAAIPADPQKPTVVPNVGVAFSSGLPASEVWLDRSFKLPRLAGNLVRGAPIPRPVTADYRIQPGDGLRLVTWGGSSMNDQLTVDPTGNIGLPGIGVLPVAGLTAGEAQQRAVALVRQLFNDGGVVLAVEVPRNSGVTVTGEVHMPGYLALPPGGTLLEAISVAGNVTSNGSLRAVVVRSPGKPQTSVDLYKLALDGDASILAPLPIGSSVHVPLAGPQVLLIGSVRRPSLVELLPGEHLSDALAFAGGLEGSADPETVRLVRETPTGQTLLAVRVADLASLTAQDGDRIGIAPRMSVDSADTVISVQGAVRNPGTHAWKEGLTVDMALIDAGGPLPTANVKSMLIQRSLAKPRQVDLGQGVTGWAYKDLLPRIDGSTLMQPHDALMVPLAPELKDQSAVISVEGAVGKPGVLPLTPDMTVNDAIKLAGGLLPIAQTERADLVREIQGELGQRNIERTQIDLTPIIKGESGPKLFNRDTLIIRVRADDRVRFTISGEVANSGTFVLPRGTTLRQAMVIAGGLTSDAFARGACFYRLTEAAEAQAYLNEMTRRLGASIAVNEKQMTSIPDAQAKQMMQLTLANQQDLLRQMQSATATGRMAGIDLAGAIAGVADADLPLLSGDRLVVPAKPGSIRVLGEVMVPGSLRFAPGLKAPDVIKRSGGTTYQADEDRVFVVRADGSVVASAAFTETAWDANTRRWTRNDLKRMELLEGDSVIIPPDLRYHKDGLELIKDWSEVLFRVATTAGTLVVLTTKL